MKIFSLKIILLLCYVSCCGQAPAIRSILERMQEEYAKTTKYHIVMSIQARTRDVALPWYQETIDLKKEDDNYLCQYGVIDVLSNEHYTITVDRGAKEISCNARVNAKEDMNNSLKMTLDSMLTFYMRPEYVETRNNSVRYRFGQKKESRIETIDLVINTKTNLLEAIDYYYRNGQQVKVEFKIFDLRPTFDSSTFDDAKYGHSVLDNWLASNDYKGYHVNATVN